MSFKTLSKFAKRYWKLYLEKHSQLENAACQAFTKLFVRWRHCMRKNIKTSWCFKIRFKKISKLSFMFNQHSLGKLL